LEKLLIPLILLSTPFFIIIILYRIWQLVKNRLEFKNRILKILYVIIIVIVIGGYSIVSWYFYKCVWPFHCGESFASGYAAAGVLLSVIVVSAGFIFSEVFRFFVVKGRE
jgi:hypothetical protein